MDKQAIFKRVAQVEEQIGELYQEVGGLKAQIVELMEENTRLVMENQRYQERLQATSKSENARSISRASVISEHTDANVPETKEGYNNLAQLYEEGFHICNVHYGRMRTEGDCLFCLAFLNKTISDE